MSQRIGRSVNTLLRGSKTIEKVPIDCFCIYLVLSNKVSVFILIGDVSKLLQYLLVHYFSVSIEAKSK